MFEEQRLITRTPIKHDPPSIAILISIDFIIEFVGSSEASRLNNGLRWYCWCANYAAVTQTSFQWAAISSWSSRQLNGGATFLFSSIPFSSLLFLALFEKKTGIGLFLSYSY